jgi:polyphosphate kinase 2 (PPK2 family)
MNQDVKELREHIKRLRADLSATNAVLLSVFEAVPAVYQEKVMTLLAERVTRQELVVEQLPDPTMQVEAERAEAAMHRLWKELEQAIRRSV